MRSGGIDTKKKSKKKFEKKNRRKSLHRNSKQERIAGCILTMSRRRSRSRDRHRRRRSRSPDRFVGASRARALVLRFFFLAIFGRRACELPAHTVTLSGKGIFKEALKTLDSVTSSVLVAGGGESDCFFFFFPVAKIWSRFLSQSVALATRECGADLGWLPPGWRSVTRMAAAVM